MKSLRSLIQTAAVLAVVLLPATASAAVPGVNLLRVDGNGDPYVNSPADTPATWRDIVASGARTVRTFVPWQVDGQQLNRWVQFTRKARAHGLAVEMVVTGDPRSMATPHAYARNVHTLARHLRGRVAAYEVWNEPDDSLWWKGGPHPADYTALLKAADRAIEQADQHAKVLVGGLVGNDYHFLAKLYAHGARGHFDGVAVHTDTACNTTDPTQYYREPTGRIGRYSFTGYREVHQTMLAHGDDKPIWMTELGWSTTGAICNAGMRAGTKPGGVTPAQQADFLTKAYRCLAGDPYVRQALWFSLHDADSSLPGHENQFGLITDAFSRKPAFDAFTRAGSVSPMPCGVGIDKSKPAVRIVRPPDGTLYYGSFPVHIHAEDAQGVQDINLRIDGRNVGLATPKGKTSDVRLTLWAAGKLPFGPHRLVATARDAARNISRTSIRVIHVGGGGYRQRIPARLRVRYGRVRHRRMTVRGRMRFAHGVRGAGTVEFRFYRRVHGRWRRMHRWHRTVYRPFRFQFIFGRRGLWRVRARYLPRGAPFEHARVPARTYRIR